jgi:hypothetical protein
MYYKKISRPHKDRTLITSVFQAAGISAYAGINKIAGVTNAFVTKANHGSVAGFTIGGTALYYLPYTTTLENQVHCR